MLIISSTGSPPWLMSWSVSKLMYRHDRHRCDPSCQERYQDDPHRFFKRG